MATSADGVASSVLARLARARVVTGATKLVYYAEVAQQKAQRLYKVQYSPCGYRTAWPRWSASQQSNSAHGGCA